MNTKHIVNTVYAIFSFVFMASSASSQSYIEINGKDSTNFSYDLKHLNEKIIISLSSSNRTEICVVDSNYFCQKWTYRNKYKNISFTAHRSVDSIHISGIKGDQNIHHSICVGSEPWLQFWEYGIGPTLRKKAAHFSFFSIDANNPDKAALFLSKNEGVEKILIGRKEVMSNRTSVTIKGLPSMIFKAKLWFRTSDHTFIRSQMPQGPFVPITTVEIES